MGIIVDKKDRVARLTLERPPLNVLDLSILGELRRELEALDGDSEIDFLVLRGGGGRAFSAGVDVKDHTRDKVPAMLDAVHGVIRRLFSLRQVTIAEVNGACLGGGWELASSCDLVLASEASFFATPEITVGCYPPVALARFPMQIGYHRSAELILTGRRLTAEEAREFGLVNRVVPAGELDQEVESLLTDLRGKSSVVLRITLEGLREVGLAALDQHLKKSEERYLNILLKSEDVEEGVEAFLNKRPPKWRNK